MNIQYLSTKNTVATIVLALLSLAMSLYIGTNCCRKVRNRRREMEDILNCPISLCAMRDPVTLLQSGHTFDRQSLCQWLLVNPTRCPLTHVDYREKLQYGDNVKIRQLIIVYLGDDAYQRYDDSRFREQYDAIVIEPTEASNSGESYTHRPLMSEGIRRILTCPISGGIMRDPVILYPSGKTFDRESLCTWLLRNETPRCPWTNQPLEKQMAYIENRDTRDILTLYLGVEAYQRFDDSMFKVQYASLWNVPTYREIAALLYGMNSKHIDWRAAQEMVAKEDEDAVIAGIKALLLFPDFRKERNLRKNESGALKEWERAEKLGLSALVDVGNPWAQWIKALLVDIIEKDYVLAKNLHKAAANQGHALSQYSLGAIYENDEDFEEAEDCYDRAAKQGHALAQYNLAMLLEPDFDRMLPNLERASSQGHPEALFYLGELHMDSDVIERDLEKARHYFERATSQGLVKARDKLVEIFATSGVVPHDNEVKRQVLEQAAEQGHVKAQYDVGVLYRDGNGVEQDYVKARNYFVLAANQGHAAALDSLGYLYNAGKGVEQNAKMARHYFELAAKQGCAEAQCNLVLFYSKGYGAEQDYEKAKQYLDLAANQGDVSEQLHLGHLFHGGLYGNMHAVNRTEDCDELPREHGPDIKDASCQNKL